MNKIRQIEELNRRELEAGIPPNASWHTDYRDSAFIYIGGLPFELSEGDILTIFSQYGEPTYINLIRDKETGKSRGFAYLKYEDQRSTDLAVDNLCGAVVGNRTIVVDHHRYKPRDDGEDTGIDLTKEAEEEDSRGKRRRVSGGSDTEAEQDTKPRRAMIKEELELEKLKRDHDDDDPMKDYLIKEKEEEVSMALAKLESRGEKKRDHKSRHHHHRSRRDDKDHSRRRSRSRDYEDERRSRRRDRSNEERHRRTKLEKDRR